jgi:hypothetical protein
MGKKVFTGKKRYLKNLKWGENAKIKTVWAAHTVCRLC